MIAFPEAVAGGCGTTDYSQKTQVSDRSTIAATSNKSHQVNLQSLAPYFKSAKSATKKLMIKSDGYSEVYDVFLLNK